MAHVFTRLGQLLSVLVVGLVAAGCAALGPNGDNDGNLFAGLGAAQSAADAPAAGASDESVDDAVEGDLFVMGRNFLGRFTQPQDNGDGTETSGFSLGGLGNLFGQNNDAASPNNDSAAGTETTSSAQNLASSTGSGRYQLAQDPYVNGGVTQTPGLRGGSAPIQSSTASLPPYDPPVRSFAYQSFDGTAAQAMTLVAQMGAGSTHAASGRNIVPLAFDALPDDLANGQAGHKELFISIMIPLAVMVNEQIAAERQAIVQAGYRGPIASAPLLVRQIANRYQVTSDVDTLLQHVDTLPVSLMIAQAIEESGWGTSRFAQEGNALFGQYTWELSDKGMVPANRPARQTFRVRAFSTLFDSAQSYALNLNRNQAYGELRAARHTARMQGQSIASDDLVQGLAAYSGDPGYYIPAIQRHLNDYSLALYDRVTLMPGQAVRVRGASAPAAY